MARPLRIEYPGAVYHITFRGNARKDIYHNEQDRKTFFKILSGVVKKYNWHCHAYCLMNNHYHLLVETLEANLSQGMRQLNGIYTQRHNKNHEIVGHVLQGRYKAVLVDKENYLLELCRYIVLNPVRAKLVELPEQWPWGSYQATAGLAAVPDFIIVDWILGMFGTNRQSAQKHYQKFVGAGLSKDEPFEELEGQVVLGSKEFVDKVKEIIKDKESIQEIPRNQRYAGRPSLEELFSEIAIHIKTIRNEMIYRAHIEYGYTLREISDAIGIHYTTVSKIVRNLELEML